MRELWGTHSAGKELDPTAWEGKTFRYEADKKLVPHVKFLEVTLDSPLNWIAHVKDKVQEAWTI